MEFKVQPLSVSSSGTAFKIPRSNYLYSTAYALAAEESATQQRRPAA